MSNPLKVLIHDYTWIHLSLGLIGNGMFFIGSILFLPRYHSLQILGVWLFIVGSALMLIGAMGHLLKDVIEPDPDGELSD